MLKVLLDISALGGGHYRPRSRTGVYRAIECLTKHLLQETECHISLTATESLVLHAMARHYHLNTASFKDTPFISPSGPIASMLQRGVEHLLAGPIHIPLALNRLEHFLPLKPAVLPPQQAERYDIVHATYFSLPDRWRGLPSTCRFQTVYDLIPLIMPQASTPAQRMITRRCIEGILPDEWVLAISQATKDDLCDYRGLDPQRVFVTHLAASELFYRCADTVLIEKTKQRYGIPEAPYILSLCTLEPRKNIPHLIRCFVDLVMQEQLHDLNLVLVGTAGWQYEKIFQQIELYKEFKDRIIITGYVADADLAPLYSGALMFVYPSLYEGFGLPPLEAMQCGVPVITSNTSSLPEVVGDGGMLVSPQDKAALCQAMLDIYRQPALAAGYAKRAGARAALFSWERCAQETVAAYKTAMIYSI